MTTDEVRATFDKVADEQRKAGNLDDAATTELLREYFTNPAFKTALEEHVWTLNN
jgi:hypothetical protein